MQISYSRLALLVAAALAIGRPATAQIDFSGEWRTVTDEVQVAMIGDYAGLPMNEAARIRADAWDASEFTLPELQCRPHPLAHLVYATNAGFRQFRWWKTIDPVTQATVAYQMHGAWMEPERTIWMDGRPHPSPYAPHSWLGFSTGRWEGTKLVVTTTHLKEGFIYSNGIPSSDQITITEVFTRHGDRLMSTAIIEDPVYLSEPLVRSSTWQFDPAMNFQQRYPCGLNEVVSEVVRPKGEVPHRLPGSNAELIEFARIYGLPFDATRGGAETMYPEYEEKVRTMKPEPVTLPPLKPGATRRPRVETN
jgi:hypothetical protein